MSSKSNRPNKLSPSNQTVIDELLGRLYAQAKAQFGDAIKSFWFHDGDMCPACAKRRIDVIKFKGQAALAINAFIYRERGVLIGYFLCGTCAKYIFNEAEKNPYRQTPLHANIEQNLTTAYLKHLASLDA